jgi:hypothetical protein
MSACSKRWGGGLSDAYLAFKPKFGRAGPWCQAPSAPAPPPPPRSRCSDEDVKIKIRRISAGAHEQPLAVDSC